MNISSTEIPKFETSREDYYTKKRILELLLADYTPDDVTSAMSSIWHPREILESAIEICGQDVALDCCSTRMIINYLKDQGYSVVKNHNEAER